MTKKDLPTIDIKGKPYVMVKDRVSYFNEKYPEGSIRTELLSDGVFKATVTPDTKNLERCFTGHSKASEGDSGVAGQSPIEVAETSAVGRALGMMGIGIVESIASADEVVNTYQPNKPVSDRQKSFINELEAKKGAEITTDFSNMTSVQASKRINELKMMQDYQADAKRKLDDELDMPVIEE